MTRRRKLTKKQNLYREHGRLVEVMFSRPGGLTRSEKHRHKLIGDQLDAIEMSQMKPDFERLEKMVEESRRAAAGVQALVDLVLPYVPPDLSQSGPLAPQAITTRTVPLMSHVRGGEDDENE